MPRNTSPHRTEAELVDLARRLVKILEDNEGRGMAVWVAARNRLGRELYDALGAALGERDGNATPTDREDHDA